MAICVFLSFLCYLRPGEALRLRGRSLVKRYAKESKLLAELHWVPAAILSFGELVEANFRAVTVSSPGGGPHPLRYQVPVALARVVCSRPGQAAAAAGRGQKRHRR